jgi:hypothetical protein
MTLNTQMSHLKKFSTCFPQVSGVVFHTPCNFLYVPVTTFTAMQGFKVLCATLFANTFLLAAPYLSRRDTGRCLGLLALQW